MILKSISLQNFRSYSQKEFQFKPGMTVVIGPNASGKTNLLEAIRLLATGRSLRASLETEMIHLGNEIARVEAVIRNQEAKEKLQVVLTNGEVAGEKAPRKRYFLNGVPKRKMDFVGQLRCVYFGPEDLAVIFGSPSQRRDYFDSVLAPVDQEYHRAQLSYQKGLRQRNKLLEQIREEGRPRSILFFWDKLLIENGSLISQKRTGLIEFINQQPKRFGDLKIEYDPSLISPQRLEQYADAEVAAGMTLVGPHRDDFRVNDQKRDLHTFGSRGEQRLAVFSLKLAELTFVIEKSGEKPVLLLDDIFSELDHEHRVELLKVIPQQQVIITATDIHLLESEYRQKAAMIKLD